MSGLLDVLLRWARATMSEARYIPLCVELVLSRRRQDPLLVIPLHK